MGVSVADLCAVLPDGGDCLELLPAHPAASFGGEWLVANLQLIFVFVLVSVADLLGGCTLP